MEVNQGTRSEDDTLNELLRQKASASSGFCVTFWTPTEFHLGPGP